MVTNKKKISKVALFSSSENVKVNQISSQIEEILNSLNVKILSCDGGSKKNNHATRKTHSDKYIIGNADLLIAIGGDGTLISASRKYGYFGVPILGINLGKVGFLTDILPKDLTNKLIDIIKGNYIEDKRVFLAGKINKQRKFNIALNEIVIHSSEIAQLIQYEVYIDECFVYRQRADGILIATATGSTAYSLSGNGPIIHPGVDGLVLMPMFAHSLNTRPLIVSDNSTIKIKVIQKGNAAISFDSHNTLRLKQDDEITISKTTPKLTLVHPQNHDYFDAYRTKLGWSLGVPQIRS